MKKIISLTVAIIIAFSFLAFPFVVSADNEDKMTTQEYYSSQAYLFAQLKDKKIDYSTYSERSTAVTDKYIADNTIIDDIGEHLGNGAKYASEKIGALGQKIGSTIDKYGDAAYDYLSSLGAGLLDGYTVQNQVPSGNMPDMKGYGAVAESILIKTPTYSGGSDDATYRRLESCDYIVLFKNGNYGLYSSNNKYLNELYTYFDGHLHMSTIYTTSVKSRSEYRTYKFYGDIRYEDGTQAPNDNTYETISDYDFTHATDKELEDLINDLLNEFELQMPDLSSIEGLLNAIYARLGTLDSDNDNELLNSINIAVLALVDSLSDNSSDDTISIGDEAIVEQMKQDNSKLLEALLEVRDLLKNGNLGFPETFHNHEISGTLYNVIPLNKNWLNKIFHDKENLKVQYEGKTYYLEDCGCLKLGDKFYIVDINYDSYDTFNYDFSSDDVDIDHLIRFFDPNKSMFDYDFGTIDSFISSTRSRVMRSSYSLFADDNVENSDDLTYDDFLTASQSRNVSGIVDLITSYVSMGVPYDDLRNNFIVYESIIFNDYLPKDITITIFDKEVTLLRYSDFVSFYDDDPLGKYETPVTIVRAFTSILIGFSWCFSMFKKSTNLV